MFVREAFSWRAALFAPLWMLVHRMWLVLLLYLIVVAALDLGLIRAGLSTQWVVLATIGVLLYNWHPMVAYALMAGFCGWLVLWGWSALTPSDLT